jgi:hypothetical protein
MFKKGSRRIVPAVGAATDASPGSWIATTRGSLPNILTDIILIVMPLAYVWRLYIPVLQRLLLGGLFMLGTFIAVVSMVHLSILMTNPLEETGDMTEHMREVIIWSCFEIDVGLACACLPNLKLALKLFGLGSLFSFTGPRSLTPGPSHNLKEDWRQGTVVIGNGSQYKHDGRRNKSRGMFSLGLRVGEDDAFQVE